MFCILSRTKSDPIDVLELYSAIDCISRNQLIAYYSIVCGPLAHEMSQDRYISL